MLNARVESLKAKVPSSPILERAPFVKAFLFTPQIQLEFWSLMSNINLYGCELVIYSSILFILIIITLFFLFGFLLYECIIRKLYISCVC